MKSWQRDMAWSQTGRSQAEGHIRGLRAGSLGERVLPGDGGRPGSGWGRRGMHLVSHIGFGLASNSRGIHLARG